VDFFDLVTEVIDLRSFSNLWYWIVLAIMWSSLSHWTLGVPYHIVARARRGDQRAVHDMQALARDQRRARPRRSPTSPPRSCWGSRCSSPRGLAVTGWLYRVEFLQALFLLDVPGDARWRADG
jgi:hypothetical protein